MCILECICIGAWGVSKREVVCVIIKARCLLVRPLRIALWVSAWFRITEYACRTPYSSTSAARISVPMTLSNIVLCVIARGHFVTGSAGGWYFSDYLPAWVCSSVYFIYHSCMPG